MSRYISNGTEGTLWMAENCFRCVHDHRFSHVTSGDGADGCPVTLALIRDTYPIPQFTESAIDVLMPSRLRCSEFNPCAECGVPADYRPSSWNAAQARP